MNTGKKEYTFLWFIENYSYCKHKSGKSLVSPEFLTGSLEGTAFNLDLFLRRETYQHIRGVYLALQRSSGDAGPQIISLEYELSVLAADGSTLSPKIEKKPFKSGERWGNWMSLWRDDALMKAEYLPQDTLCVRCRISMGKGEVQPQAQINARTRIAMEQISFVHVTENFSTRKPNHKETERIKFLSNKGLYLSCSLCFPEDFNGDGKIMVKIAPSESKYFLSVCRLFLIEKSGKKIECGEINNSLAATINDLQLLPLSLSRKVILDRKIEYLPDDKLSVLVECKFSSGIEHEKIENTIYGKHYKAVNHESYNNKNDDKYVKQLSTCPGALDDLKAMYNNKFLTDVELKTKTKSFFAHKNILCSRSSVLKVMLANDMKEKITNCIQIDDLEDDTVQQFLLFLYSDALDNLEWDSAIKLYYAGDKYSVEKLKLTCSSFLLKNLSTSNAIELLLLADKHSDSYLKKAVEEFILSNEEEVFGSEEWRNLIKANSVLVSETMCLKYMRK